MLLTGMNVARLNFSHGNFESHRQVIENLRSAAAATHRRLAIMAPLVIAKIEMSLVLAEAPNTILWCPSDT